MQELKTHTGIPAISDSSYTFTLTGSTALDIPVPTGAKYAKFRSTVPATDVFYLWGEAGALLPGSVVDVAGYQEAKFNPSVAGGDSTGLAADTAGYQEVTFGFTALPIHLTGFADDATSYDASIVVDGGAPQAIAVLGSAAQTFDELVDELNADTTGATWALADGVLTCTSDATGTSSTIAITDDDLFSNIVPGGGNIEAAVAGTTTLYTASVYVDGSATPYSVSLSGESAQTFTNLLTQLNTDVGTSSAGSHTVTFAGPITGASDPGLPDDTYQFGLSVDGAAATTITITTSSTTTFTALATLLQTAVQTETGDSDTVAVVGSTIVFTRDATVTGAGTGLVVSTPAPSGTDPELFTEIDQAETFGTPVEGRQSADVTLTGGNIRFTSENTTEVGSSVSIVDGTLFAALNSFDEIGTAVDGYYGSGGMLCPDTVHLGNSSTISLISAGTPTINVQFFG